MPFLTLNGHTFEVADATASKTIKRSGKRSRAYRGQMRDATRGQRVEWKFRSCFTEHEDAETLIHVVNGDGHLVRFNEGWDAHTGLQPEVASLSGITFDQVENPFSSFAPGALMADGFGPHLKYDAQLCEEWTIDLFTRTDGELWKRYTKTDDGRFFLDGVRDDSMWDNPAGNLFVDVADGRVGLRGNGSDFSFLAHMSLLPFRASTLFIDSWHASTSTPWGGLPLLRAQGDFITEDFALVFGEVTGVDYVGKPSYLGAPFGWVNNAEVVDFTLSLVPDGFESDDSVPS